MSASQTPALIHESEESLVFGDHTFRIISDPSVGIGGHKWPAADMFCKVICEKKWISFFSGLFAGKSVIELGAGTGLVSVLVDRLFECQSIIVTDLESHIPLIERNLTINNTSSRCIAKSYNWIEDDFGSYDIILVFECVYNESLYSPLIQTLGRLCGITSLVFLGLTRLFMKPSFFSLLRDAGFVYTLLPESCLPSQYSDQFTHRDVGLFVVRRCRIWSRTNCIHIPEEEKGTESDLAVREDDKQLEHMGTSKENVEKRLRDYILQVVLLPHVL